MQVIVDMPLRVRSITLFISTNDIFGIPDPYLFIHFATDMAL